MIRLEVERVMVDILRIDIQERANAWQAVVGEGVV